MTLPPIPKDRNWSPETWRAGLDEAVRRDAWTCAQDADQFFANDYGAMAEALTIAHATTLLDAGIVKPVVSEAEQIHDELQKCMTGLEKVAVIQSALDKARGK